MQMQNSKGNVRIIVDGVELHDEAITLIDDRKEHSVEIRLVQCGSSALSD
jgi:hypothetical protein